jgi:hypothetical protein
VGAAADENRPGLEALELLPLGRDEAAPLHEVLGGVAADHLLGEGADGRDSPH